MGESKKKVKNMPNNDIALKLLPGRQMMSPAETELIIEMCTYRDEYAFHVEKMPETVTPNKVDPKQIYAISFVDTFNNGNAGRGETYLLSNVEDTGLVQSIDDKLKQVTGERVVQNAPFDQYASKARELFDACARVEGKISFIPLTAGPGGIMRYVAIINYDHKKAAILPVLGGSLEAEVLVA